MSVTKKQINEIKIPKKDKKDPEGLHDVIDILEKTLTPRRLEIVKKIGFSIQNTGITLVDACILARIEKDEIDEWTEYCPAIKTYFLLKRMEYKYKLLEIVNAQAKEQKDVKMAMWLLEQHFAEDYDSSVKKEMEKYRRSGEEDVMEMAIAFIRKTGSHATPVNTDQQKHADATPTQFTELKEILT